MRNPVRLGTITTRIHPDKLVRLRIQRKLYREFVKGALSWAEYETELVALDDYEPDGGGGAVDV